MDIAMDATKKLCSRGADYFNCRMMPHGGPVLFPIVLTTLGLCASLAEDGCDYARLRGAAVEMLTGSAAVPFVDCGMSAYRTPGFYPSENSWRVVYSQECQPYEYMGLLADTSWVAAEWLRFLSVVMGGTTSMFLWTSTCLTLRPNYWQAAGIGVALACVFQMCSFVWFYTKLCHTSTTDIENFEAGRESEGNATTVHTSSCDLYFGSKCAITACVLYAVASAIILFRKYPVPIPRFIVQDENEKIAIMNAPETVNSTMTPAGRRRDPRRMRGRKKSPIRNSEISAHSRQSWVASTPAGGGHDNNYRPAQINYSSKRPVTSVRPKELSGSNLSAVSFV